jgi:hypothetical protein
VQKLWDKFLMGNLAFLGLCFLWFSTLVLVKYLFVTDWGWAFFLQAWTYVINPSLGIFFMGVIISFVQSKINRPKKLS